LETFGVQAARDCQGTLPRKSLIPPVAKQRVFCLFYGRTNRTIFISSNHRRFSLENRSSSLSEGEGRSAANALSKPMLRRTPTGFHDLPLKVAPTLSALFGLPSQTQTLSRCLRSAISPVRAGFLPRRPLLDSRRIPSRGALTTARLVKGRSQTIYPSIRR
jgi:hypothetical protein